MSFKFDAKLDLMRENWNFVGKDWQAWMGKCKLKGHQQRLESLILLLGLCICFIFGYLLLEKKEFFKVQC